MLNFQPDLLLNLLRPEILFFAFAGTLFGIIVGAIPGLNAAIGITLLLRGRVLYG